MEKKQPEIKIKMDPEAYVIGMQQFNKPEMELFLSRGGLSLNRMDAMTGSPSEQIIEMATRLCYMSFSKGRDSDTFHTNLLESHHGSTMEHGVFTLLLSGVSRTFTHELIRHRAGFSYSQLSQRYVDHSDMAFIMPPYIQQCPPEVHREWAMSCLQAQSNYKALIRMLRPVPDDVNAGGTPKQKTEMRKLAKEAARSLLPGCIETYIAVTANIRAWRHFFELRSEKFAEMEMRRVAVVCWQALSKYAPYLLDDYMLTDDGELITDYKKV